MEARTEGFTALVDKCIAHVDKCIAHVAPEVAKLTFSGAPSYSVTSTDFLVSDMPKERFTGGLACLNRPVKVLDRWSLEELFSQIANSETK